MGLSFALQCCSIGPGLDFYVACTVSDTMAYYSDPSVVHYIEYSDSANRFSTDWFWSHGWMYDVEGAHLRASSLGFFFVFLVFLLLSVGIDRYWKPCLSFLSFCSHFHPSCPGCVNVMRGKHTDWFSVRKLVWNQHICEHHSPRCLSVINYLCTESQETISKDKLLCISSFLIFKAIADMENLCWRLSWMSSRSRQCGGCSGGKEEIIKKREKILRDFFFPDVRLMRCHADRVCCPRALCRHSKGGLP